MGISFTWLECRKASQTPPSGFYECCIIIPAIVSLRTPWGLKRVSQWWLCLFSRWRIADRLCVGGAGNEGWDNISCFVCTFGLQWNHCTLSVGGPVTKRPTRGLCLFYLGDYLSSPLDWCPLHEHVLIVPGTTARFHPDLASGLRYPRRLIVQLSRPTGRRWAAAVIRRDTVGRSWGCFLITPCQMWYLLSIAFLLHPPCECRRGFMDSVSVDTLRACYLDRPP